MIFVDADFAQVLGLEDCKSVSGLAKESGAQIVVSKKLFPPTGELLSKHADDGSAFVVVSTTWDGVVPTGIYKVSEIGAKVKYHIILGSITCAENGEAVHEASKFYGFRNGRYADYVEYMARISSFGFSAVNIEPEYLGLYVTEINKSIGTLIEFMPSDTYEFVPIRDWRATLSAIPSIGATRAQYLYDEYTKDGGELPSLLDVLSMLTDYERNKRPVSKVICAGTRAWLGIPDGFNLSLDVLTGD